MTRFNGIALAAYNSNVGMTEEYRRFRDDPENEVDRTKKDWTKEELESYINRLKVCLHWPGSETLYFYQEEYEQQSATSVDALQYRRLAGYDIYEALRRDLRRNEEIKTISTTVTKTLPVESQSHTKARIETVADVSEDSTIGSQYVPPNGDSTKVLNEAVSHKIPPFLPITIHKTKLRCNDIYDKTWKHRIISMKEVLNYRNRLCEQERYSKLRTVAERRRVQELLLRFIERNGGRVLMKVPDRFDYYYVVSRSRALFRMATMLRNGPTLPDNMDDASVHSFPADEMSVDDDDFLCHRYYFLT